MGDNFYVYYGGFDQDGRKNDDDAIYYDNARDTIFKGKIVNDKFTSGYMVCLNENDELKNLIYVEIDNNDFPTKMLKTQELEENIRETVFEQAKQFKYSLIERDYFTDIYDKVKDIRTFVQTKLNNLAIFDSEEAYPKIFKMSSEYNVNNMFKELKSKQKKFLD
jgi:hypothetical protein